MTQIISKELKEKCNECQKKIEKGSVCAWLSLGNEYCTDIMVDEYKTRISKAIEYNKEYLAF